MYLQYDSDETPTICIKGSLRAPGLLFKNDRFICTDSQKKTIKTNKFTSIEYLNLIL